MANLSVARMILLCALAVTTAGFRVKDSASLTTGVVEETSKKVSGECGVARVKDVCNCNHRSFWEGYQCSSCKINTKWGYGCDLACPAECTLGCDFSGNCLPDVNAVKPNTDNCKRNGRVPEPTAKAVKLNEREECQACKDGFFGYHCESTCPNNCADTDEGACTRGGKCYECKDGWFGQDCSSTCPEGCPSCVMRNNLVRDEESPDEFLPAGYCNVQCETDNWGPTCQTPCPTNCKDYSGKASCAKDSGICKKCQDHVHFGPKCEVACSAGCLGGKCAKASGTCEDGCKPGYWGDKCDQACPDGSIGSCDRQTGLPEECQDGTYPQISEQADTAECVTCPVGCKNGKCHQDGSCSQGCLLGKYGPQCEEGCPVTCDGPCDEVTTGESDGECLACTAGFTGSRCHKPCHSTCSTCTQRGNAIGPDDCTSCPADEPTVLDGSTCDCIEGASRNEAGNCVCDEPEDPDKDAFFELTPQKICRAICKGGTREVFGESESTCMIHKKYKAVILAEGPGLEQGDCPVNTWNIPIQGAGSECIRADFVSNILQA